MTNDNLNTHLLQTFLNTLSPVALAAVAADLENSVEDWEFYPEDAPPENIRQELTRLLEQILKRGREQTPNFDDLLDEARSAQDADDWISGRNQQVRQNWYSDLK